MKIHTRQRNVSIEVLRVVACFLVIMAHIQLKPVIAEGIFNWKRICFSSIIGDNVPIFFLITGYYMFKKIENDEDIFTHYKYKVKSFAVKIWFPSLFIVIITCILEPWLNGGQLGEPVQWDMLQQFVFRVTANDASGHLWYVCTYIRFIVFFPLLAFLCQDKTLNNKIRRIYIALSMLNIILQDIEYLVQKDIVDYSKIVFDPYFLYLFLGNELRIILAKQKNLMQVRILGGGAYFFGNMLKFILQYYAFSHWGTGVKSWYMGLEGLPAYISSCGIFLLFYSMKNNNWKTEKLWIFLGKYSFYIYICHLIVLKKLQSLQFQDYFRNMCGGTEFIDISLYYLKFGLIVFILSLLAGIFFEKIYSYLINAIRIIFTNIKEYLSTK